MGILALLLVGGLGAGLVVTYAAPDELAAPTDLSAKPLSPTSVELDWKDTQEVDSYVVKVGPSRSLTAAKSQKIPAGEQGKGPTTVTLDDLAASTPGVDQFYRVDAVRDGKVRSSRTARFTLKPGDVTKVSVKLTTTDGVSASWNKVPNARQFEVSIARDKSFTKKAETVRTLKASHRFVTRGLKSASLYWMKVRPVNGDQSGAFSKPVSFTTQPRQTSFKVGTWNVCSEKCSGYPGRARIMADFLDANKIDMFGLQESGGKRVGATTNAIFSGHSQKYVRAAGGARARYIFFRPALFTQISGGSFPIGDGRDTTWGKFSVKKTGRVFYFVDIHLENGKGNDAKRAREMNVVLSRMSAINDTGKPMIWAGDFNSGRHRSADSPGVKMRAAGYTDTVEMVKNPVNAQISTSHTFATTVLRARAHVDHIWVSKQFSVDSWAQLVRLNGARYASPVVSDHNALSAVVSLDVVTGKLGEPTATTPVDGLSPSLR